MYGPTDESGLITSQHMTGEPVRTCEPAVLDASTAPDTQEPDGEESAIVRGED